MLGLTQLSVGAFTVGQDLVPEILAPELLASLLLAHAATALGVGLMGAVDEPVASGATTICLSRIHRAQLFLAQS